MNWQRIKTASEVRLAGIAVSLEVIDKSICGITLRDKDGNTVRASKQGYSDFAIFIPAEPEMKEVFKLHGKYRGKVDMCESFPSQYEADQRHRELDYDDNLKIDGVTEAVKEDAPAPELADIPF